MVYDELHIHEPVLPGLVLATCKYYVFNDFDIEVVYNVHDHVYVLALFGQKKTSNKILHLIQGLFMEIRFSVQDAICIYTNIGYNLAITTITSR